MKKVIFDTDIGDDIDDAFALASLAAETDAELVGVTTVYRNTAQRAQLAQRLLRAAGKPNVPVFAGEEIPTKEPIRPFVWEDGCSLERKNVCQWCDEYASLPVQTGAAEFLAESAKRWKDELIIFAVGPLTNLARAIERFPEEMQSVGAIYTMGGCFLNPSPEWNILCDPEAAQTVYSSGIPLYAIGLDVTLRCTLEGGLLERVASSKGESNRLLSLWFDRWLKHFGFEKSVMHDPLAVASAFQPLCRFETRYVRADLEQERGAFSVRCSPQEGYSPVNIAVDVDRKAFYEWLESRLGVGKIGQDPKI